jgi:prepilin-type N-terminal cleavage/methylation domain-containing protein
VTQLRTIRRSEGFTVIELMTAIVILTVLVMVAIPNFIGRMEKAREAQVMSNMRMLQIMLETYRTDWMEYPPDLANLAAAADLKNYNKEGVNPYSNSRARLGTPNVWAIDYVNPGPAGYCGYQYQNKTSYQLFGYDKKGELIKRNAQPFVMKSG